VLAIASTLFVRFFGAPAPNGRLGAHHHASRQREVSVVGELGLAVDVAQNAAAGVSDANNPSDNTAASRE
jgi:hypothetical protein